MNNKMEHNEAKTSAFATKLGHVVGTLCACCIAACIAAVLIALTCRLIMWIL